MRSARPERRDRHDRPPPRYTLDRTQREYVEIIRGSGTTLLSLINDVFDVSRIEAGHLELERVDFRLRDLAAEIASALGSTRPQRSES